MADVVRGDVLDLAQSLHDQGKNPEAYAVLGRHGDEYADKAWAITNDQFESALDFAVSFSWSVAAPGLRDAKFSAVARDHQQQYLDLTRRDTVKIRNEMVMYSLPDSLEIEHSYYNALVKNNVPPGAAIDFFITEYTKCLVHWAKLLGITKSRILDDHLNIPLEPQECFPAHIPIALASGATAQIENIAIGDSVLAFASGTTSLTPARVKHLFHNVTEEWIELYWVDPVTGEIRSLTATPGHAMATPDGGWKQLGQMIVPLSGAVLLRQAQDEVKNLSPCLHAHLPCLHCFPRGRRKAAEASRGNQMRSGWKQVSDL